jgi:MocE subfamily Rieske [2Fe-2S] domain protein
MSNWIEACAADDIEAEDVIRFDHAGQSYAIYRSPDDRYYATDGWCTHERTHLADGLVMDEIIECPKHNGRFDYRTGKAKGAPVCVDLRTFPVKVEGGPSSSISAEPVTAGIVIVGGGEAGARAAMALREAGHEGPISLLAEEGVPPYERPPLSKAVLTGEAAAPVVLSPAMALERRIDLRLGCGVTGIDRQARRVVLEGGGSLLTRSWCWRRVPGRARSPCRVARRRCSCGASGTRRHFWHGSGPVSRLGVIGGGFIGLEGRRQRRRARLPGHRHRAFIPADGPDRARADHPDHGRPPCPGGCRDPPRGQGGAHPRREIVLAGGERLAVDVIVAGIGAVAETTLAAGAGLALDKRHRGRCGAPDVGPGYLRHRRLLLLPASPLRRPGGSGSNPGACPGSGQLHRPPAEGEGTAYEAVRLGSGRTSTISRCRSRACRMRPDHPYA